MPDGYELHEQRGETPRVRVVETDQRLRDGRIVVERTLECADAELVETARNGDVSGFGELYRRHYAAAVGIAFCAPSDHHLAEDAAQEAFQVNVAPR